MFVRIDNELTPDHLIKSQAGQIWFCPASGAPAVLDSLPSVPVLRGTPTYSDAASPTPASLVPVLAVPVTAGRISGTVTCRVHVGATVRNGLLLVCVALCVFSHRLATPYNVS
jgi:hypothetical protein